MAHELLDPFGLAPVSIGIEANVWRHSCIVRSIKG
jgi:hypothetical protein